MCTQPSPIVDRIPGSEQANPPPREHVVLLCDHEAHWQAAGAEHGHLALPLAALRADARAPTTSRS